MSVSAKIAPSPSATNPQGSMNNQHSMVHNHIANNDSNLSNNHSVKPIESQVSVEDINNKLYLMSAFTANALSEKKKGDSSNYNQLVYEISPEGKNAESDLHKLALWLQSITFNVSALDRQCVSLLSNILDLPWMTQDDDFVNIYTRLLCTSVSAHSFFINPILQNIAKLFWEEYPLKELPRKTVIVRIHSLLKSLLTIVPTAHNYLSYCLVQAFPHKHQSAEVQGAYVGNVIRVIRYAPMLQDQLLSLIIEKIIQVDVEIQVEIEDLQHQDQPEPDQDVFALDLNQPGDLGDSSNTNMVDDDNNEVIQAHFDIKEMLTKLDKMLYKVFKYLNYSITSKDEERHIFEVLLSVFDKHILLTFKSRYTQFLLFYFCSKEQAYIDRFLGLLISNIQDVKVPQVTRCASASYLGSFVARAKYLNFEYIRMVMSLLTGWLTDYIEQNETPASLPDPTKHAVFYAASQSALYLFCFRWRSFLLGGLELSEAFMQGKDNGKELWHPCVTSIRHIVLSRLNPLMIVAPLVTQQFSKIAKQVDFMYSFSIIESNRKMFLPHLDDFFKNRDDSDIFFPFDPYQLQQTSNFIDPLYQQWHDVNSHIELNSDDEDDLGNGKNMSHSDSEDEIDLGVSLMAMSLSPAMAPYRR